jgi:Tfp pilus assembly protein PilV
MPKIDWQIVYDGATDITDKVLSMNITQGREKYLDTYSGGSCTFTINNSANYASTITYGTVINVRSLLNDSTQFFCDFWVQEITFDDHPGNTGLNTATITAVDWISRAGRILADSLSLPQLSTGDQLRRFVISAGGPLPADMAVNTGPGGAGSLASATTYTGSVNNYMNLLVTTERGYVVLRGSTLTFVERPYVSSLVPIATTLGRTTSASQIAYQTFERLQNGTQFINTATISPDGLASQTSVNLGSVVAYGSAAYSSSTVDYTTTQAVGNADWIVNNFSDLTTLRFACSLTDVAQNATALTAWLTQCWGSFNRSINLSYQVPGGSSVTTPVVMEGASINVTPESTQFAMTFSPLQYYQFFTLDSTTLGILDTSRLGW